MKSFELKCQKCGELISLTDPINQELAESFLERSREESKLLEVRISNEVREKSRLEIDDMKAAIEEKRLLLSDFAQRELELRRRQRELEDSQVVMKLEMQKAIDSERSRVETEVSEKLNNELGLRIAEKDKQLESMRSQIDELKRRAEQGSVQLQGDVQEIAIQKSLGSAFSQDLIEGVPKGVRGGDVLQRVRSNDLSVAGIILWESKRTRTWSDGWITKLKDDQRAIGADLSVIVTQTLPKGVSRFRFIDGVWVTDFNTCMDLAVALRHNLISVFQTKAASATQGGVMDLLREYLTGITFRHRIEAMVENMIDMKDCLENEKRSVQKMWMAREGQMKKLGCVTEGFVDDLRGIVGNGLPEVSLLKLKPKRELIAGSAH